MRNLYREFLKLDTTYNEEMYRSMKSGCDLRNQRRALHKPVKCGSDEICRRILEGL